MIPADHDAKSASLHPARGWGRRFFVVTCMVTLVAGSLFVQRSLRAENEAKPMIAHNVYFSLKDKSPAARQKLVDACDKYLSAHPGTVFYAAGVVADGLDRPVNDRDWDVGLHVIFTDMAAHDTYQEAPLHKQFIEENKDNWDHVRVFDSEVHGKK